MSSDALAERLSSTGNAILDDEDLALLLESGINPPTDPMKASTLQHQLSEAAKTVTALSAELQAERVAISTELERLDDALAHVYDDPPRCEQQMDAILQVEGSLKYQKEEKLREQTLCNERIDRAERISRGFETLGSECIISLAQELKEE